MTALLWQTALLLLGAYFLGAWTACILRRIVYAGSRDEAARSSVAQPLEVLGPPPPPQRLADVAPVAPRIEPIATAASRAEAPPAPLEPLPPAAPAAGLAPAAEAPSATAPAQQRAAPVPAAAPAGRVETSTPPSEPPAPAVLPAAASTSGQSSTSAPAVTPAPPAGDDLTRIRGIDPALAAKLRHLGVRRYSDIAAWRADDVQRVSEHLGFDGRIERENWIEQAQILAGGGDTYFSRRVQRGEMATASPSADEGEPPRARPPASPARPAEAPRPEGDGLRPARLTEAIQSTRAESEALRRPDMATLRSVRSEALRGSEAPAPAPPRAPRTAGPDDLKRIRGIGVLIEKKLNALGIATYEQIANWTAEDIERVSRVLEFKGRIERENWVEQARILASGGQTEYARRIERGEIDTRHSRLP
jgi:predicted flap endonuclease-1-like 5' DNA nuclease